MTDSDWAILLFGLVLIMAFYALILRGIIRSQRKAIHARNVLIDHLRSSVRASSLAQIYSQAQEEAE